VRADAAVRAARGAAATYGERGLQVIGFPCNQFMGQEPGSMDEILEYCSVTYGVSFPVMDKVR
jgi:glutathione peroxidase